MDALASGELVTFVATTDMSRARGFYGTTLGLRLEEENSFACVFNVSGTRLRVTAVEAMTPAPHTVLGWTVWVIAEVIRHLRDRGVVFLHYGGMEQDSLGVWTAPGGTSIAWFTDPDGNVLSLTQLSD